MSLKKVDITAIMEGNVFCSVRSADILNKALRRDFVGAGDRFEDGDFIYPSLCHPDYL